MNISPCGIGLEFFVVLNAKEDNNVELNGDQCLVDDDGGVLDIIGSCNGFIPEGTKRTFSLIAPIINPYQRRGYCSIYVDSKSSRKQTNKREIVNINFDTTVKHTDPNNPNLKVCKEKDEDPLNNCAPVDCDSFYNGKRSYYHPKYKRCIAQPQCISTKETPDVIYNPNSNECIEDSITQEDIDFIKEIDAKPRLAKDVLILQNLHNNSDVVESYVNADELKRRAKNKTKTLTKEEIPDEYYIKVLMKDCFVGHKAPLFILSLVISIQCCLICVMMYCLTKTCGCFKDKKVVRKFFNYHQDVSVTTPLINTSNIDTETTDYQFFSESSKVDQKIKCYKACQKEITKNVRPSMSDDILSKCLNRRDWGKHTRSDIIQEINETNDKEKVIANDDKTEVKVMFEEKEAKNSTNSEVNKKKTSDKNVEANWSSERELKCHSYNVGDSNITGFISNQPKTTRYITEQPRKGTISLSTAKGAQAYFSNDSIDDFLSERGMIYLAGENVSKYTFTDSSELKPSSSSVSSKTSKNFVKHVLSLIQKKPRGHSSDPGGKKDPLDVELLHMSKATVYSSSDDSEYKKRFRKQKESKTSL
ncbi:uncharacterized protein LOC123704276 [Colias croceus]|uniref:uncharacterized protein LOC123704276 n=1 Tax=Colias crocea TaxID=72248 RepID=UPI001E27CB78|nr:uncharacterized protein LOC123704276 [Colias croceus]